MGSNRRKRTKQCSESDISDVNESTQPRTPDFSDFDENSQSPTTSTNDTPQHFPRFILVESKEEGRQITSLSPCLIQKVIQSIAGEPENIKNYTDRTSYSLRYPRKPMPRIFFVHRLFTT